MTSYNFKPYDPANPIAPATGNRLSKCLYRADDKGEKKEAACIELPELAESEVQESMVALLPHVIEWLHGIQDGIVKDHHKGGYTAVEDSALEVSALIDTLEAAGEGKLNRDKVFTWFDSEVHDLLAVALADKMGLPDEPTDEQAAKLQEVVTVYRTRFGALAGGRSTFVPDEAEKLKRALEVTETDSTVIGTRMARRLDKMINPPTAELLGL